MYNTILPVSIFCTVFGLATVERDNAVIRKLQEYYCFTLAMLMIAFCASSLIRQDDMEITVNNVLFLFTGIGVAFTLVCYMFKFILRGNVNRCVLKNLDYAGKCLDSIAIKVSSHVEDFLTCYVTVILIMTIRMVISYPHLFNGNTVRTHNNNIFLIESIFGTLIKIILGFSIMSLEMYIFIILYFLKIRLNTLHQTILTFVYRRNTAWVVCSRINCTENCLLFRKLYSIYCSLNKAYYNAKGFYITFFRLQLISFICSHSLFLVITFNQQENIYFILMIINTIISKAVPLWLLTGIKSELNNIQISVLKMYNENRLQVIETTLNKWIIRSIHTDVIFDCGYFVLDVSLFSFVFDFIVFFLFAMK